jgi:hypothetical protein
MGPQPGDQKETRRKQTDERTVLVDDHVEQCRDNIRTAFILVKEDCGRRRHQTAGTDRCVNRLPGDGRRQHRCLFNHTGFPRFAGKKEAMLKSIDFIDHSE